MKKLAINGIYKHFKGDYYCVVGISEPIYLDELLDLSEIGKVRLDSYRSLHTEKNRHTSLYKADDGTDIKYFHNRRIEDGELVIYKCISNLDKADLYLRPVDMFLSEVDSKKYPEVEQKNRFEFVGTFKEILFK